MEKRDLLVILAAICIVLLLAMYVKPLITGQEVKIIPAELEGLLSGKDDSAHVESPDDSFYFPTPTPEPGPSYTSIIPDSFAPDDPNATIEIIGRGFTPSMGIIVDKEGINQTLTTRLEEDRLVAYNLSLTKGRWVVKFFDSTSNVTYTTQHVVNVIPTPTPDPGWDGKPVSISPEEEIRYGILPREYPVTSDQRYSFAVPPVQLKTYTTINGKNSQITGPINIPSQYWELWYSVDLPEDLQNPMMEEISKDEADRVQSLSSVIPSFQITVIDYETKDVIRQITPTGGLDPKVWKGIFGREESEKTTILSETGDEIEVSWDPRPWKDKFFDGSRSFQLEIIPMHITSYSIEIKVPDPATGNQMTSEDKINWGEYFGSLADRYVTLYNGNFTYEPNRTKMLDLFSLDIRRNKGDAAIIQELSLMKSAGIKIKEYERTNSFYRLHEGNLKGYFIQKKNGDDTKIPYEIDLINENGIWRINTLPIIRY